MGEGWANGSEGLNGSAAFDPERITFSGDHGQRILSDILRVSCGEITADEAADEVYRGPDGRLKVRVSEETLLVLSGLADVTHYR